MANREGTWCVECGHVTSGTVRVCPACGGRTLGGAKTVPATPAMSREQLGVLWEEMKRAEADTMPERPKVGNLELLETLGKGSWGTVYRAKHKSLGTSFAVKVLHENLSSDEVMIERFRREALTCSKLKHPNIVFVTDFGVDHALGVYLVMEYLEGETLGDRMKRGRLPIWEAAWIAGQLCDGLGAAHDVGTVHRDLKPDNVFLVERDGLPIAKILDFGIAQLGGRHGALTSAGFMLGTPSYMAPEQLVADRAKMGPRTDIYAIGAVLFEMVSGRRPFEGDSVLELSQAKLLGEAKRLGEVMPELAGSQLEALLVRMLHDDVDLRPTDAAAVKAGVIESVEELEMRGLAGAAPPTESPISRPVPRLRRSSVRLGLPTEDDLHPDSALVGLVRMMEDPSSAQPSVVLLACVGFVLAEFSSHDPAGVRTRAASTTFVNLGCMAVAGGDMDAVAAATKALLLAVDEPQREAVLQELRPLLTFTNFPLEQLPAWARKPRSWSGIRQLFAKDVSALFKRK